MAKIKLSALNVMVIVIAGILLFIQGAGLVYFAGKTQTLSKQLQALKPDYEKVKGIEQDVQTKYGETQNKYREIQNKYRELSEKSDTLLKENEALKEDRNNLLVRAKKLLVEKGNVKELEETLEIARKEKNILEEEKAMLDEKTLSLQEEIARQEEAIKGISSERDELKTAYEKAVKIDTVRELKGELSSIRGENKKITNDLKQAEKDISKLTKRQEKDISKLTKRIGKLQDDNVELTNGLTEYKENYAEAVKKNKGLEKEAKKLPRKFTEIARQNKKLIKESAERHYNLGVFYTKHGEYKRAAVEFEKSVEINPDSAETYFNLGYIYAEYLKNHQKAMKNFRYFLGLAKGDDKDIDWVKRYLLVWQTFEGREPIE